MRDAFTVGHDPTLERDLGFGIRQLVDIAERTLSQSSRDSTTAREVVMHLGAVLRELLLRDLPATSRSARPDAGSSRPRSTSLEEYVDAAFDRIRTYGAQYPEVALTLLSTIGTLLRELERARAWASAARRYGARPAWSSPAPSSRTCSSTTSSMQQGARDAGCWSMSTFS